MTKAQQADAIVQLREWIKPGDSVYTILESVRRSGMPRGDPSRPAVREGRRQWC